MVRWYLLENEHSRLILRQRIARFMLLSDGATARTFVVVIYAGLTRIKNPRIKNLRVPKIGRTNSLLPLKIPGGCKERTKSMSKTAN